MVAIKLDEIRKREGRLQELKEAKLTHIEEYQQLKEEVIALTQEARELRNRAQTIEDAVYDLKAVNPNSSTEEDTRTPVELLQIIETKGQEVIAALALLRQS